MAESQDSGYLRRAAELALHGTFRVEPNPRVGCVIVRKGRVVGEGWHARWGGPHAEVAALGEAGSGARSATVYVTLEPCGHRGKTPPCADALIEAGVREVVYALSDPNPDTAGVGVERLRAAGVRVRKARMGLRRTLGGDVERRTRCWVVAKWAMTLDGHIASRARDAGWVTTEKTRRWAHRELRAHADAIVVGAGTVRADDPRLTNRGGRGRQPLRVVVCGRRPLPHRARIVHDGRPVLLAAPEGFRAPKGAEVLTCGRGRRVQPRQLLRKLHARGLERILVEGGAELLGSLFDRDLVDQVCVFVAPKIVGGISAVAAVAGRGKALMSEALELKEAVHRVVGPDHVIEGYVERESP